MLTMTPVAAEAVRRLLESSSIDDADGGIRITAGEETPEGTPLQLALVDGPEPADHEMDEGGAHVFIEAAVAPFLDDKVLDAQLQEGGVAFAVRDQGEVAAENDGRPEAW